MNTARLYKQFVTAAAKMKDYNIEYYVEKATSILRNIRYTDSTETKLKLSFTIFTRKKYAECLQLIASIRNDYEEKHLEMDLIIHIELYLYEAIIFLACGDYEQCESVILDALAFSKSIKCIIKQMNFIVFYLIKK